jgi:Helix-turn-helix domain
MGGIWGAEAIEAPKSTHRLNRGIYSPTPHFVMVAPYRSRCGTISMRVAAVTNDPDALITEVQAADQLRLSVRTLQAWRTRAFGPAYVQAGRAVRYRRRDLIAWIEASTVSPSRPAAGGPF